MQEQAKGGVAIEDSWKHALQAEFSKPYFASIKTFLKQEKAAGKVIYPPGQLIFNAFNLTPFDAVKVVILGQDPYHGPGQAHPVPGASRVGTLPRMLRAGM